MQIKIQGEAPFQVLATNFSISPSVEGYTLQVSADGTNFSDLFAVGANVTRMVTGVANGSYYRCSGNNSEIQVNWQRQTSEGGGGGTAGVSSLNGQTGALTTKTINNQSILGSGNIEVGGGSSAIEIVLREGDDGWYSESSFDTVKSACEAHNAIFDLGEEHVVPTYYAPYPDEGFWEIFYEGNGFRFTVAAEEETVIVEYAEIDNSAAYTIVDELPGASEGEMVYLTAQQDVYEDVDLPFAGVELNMSQFEDGARYDEFVKIIAHHPSWGETANTIFFIDKYEWLSDKVYIRAEWCGDAYLSKGNSIIMSNDSGYKYYIDYGADGILKVACISYDSDFYDVQFDNPESTIISGEFVVVSILTKTYKPGQYLYKDDAWTGVAEMPTIKQGQSVSTAEWDAIVNAYNNKMPYRILVNIDGRYYEAHITYLTDTAFEASTSGYMYDYFRQGRITVDRDGGFQNFEWFDIRRDSMSKQMVEVDANSITIPAGTEYVFDSATWFGNFEDTAMVAESNYNMLKLEIWGRPMCGVNEELVTPDGNWHYFERDGAEIWVKPVDYYNETAGENRVKTYVRINENCYWGNWHEEGESQDTHKSEYTQYFTESDDNPEITVGTKLIKRTFDAGHPEAKTALRNLDLDYIVVGGHKLDGDKLEALLALIN